MALREGDEKKRDGRVRLNEREISEFQFEMRTAESANLRL